MAVAYQNVPVVPVDGSEFINRLRDCQLPTQQQYIDYLTSLGTIQGIFLLACGLVYLLYGWKVFRILVIVNVAILGAFGGSYLGGMLKGANMPLFGTLAGAILSAALAWPLMKFAVSIMGGLVGSVLGFFIWSSVSNATGNQAWNQYAWAGALIGLLTLGLLAFIIFRVVIITFTSFQGAFMTVGAIIALSMQADALREKILNAFAGNPHLMMLVVLVPAMIGFLVQYTGTKKKADKKPAATAGENA
jgi:MFS family permease